MKQESITITHAGQSHGKKKCTEKQDSVLKKYPTNKKPIDYYVISRGVSN